MRYLIMVLGDDGKLAGCAEIPDLEYILGRAAEGVTVGGEDHSPVRECQGCYGSGLNGANHRDDCDVQRAWCILVGLRDAAAGLNNGAPGVLPAVRGDRG